MGIILFFPVIISIAFAQNINLIEVDLATSKCSHPDGIFVGDNDMIQLTHRPRFNGIQTINQCHLTIRTDTRRRLKYSIDNMKFYECGVTISLFNDPRANLNAKYHFKCSSTPGLPIREQTPYNSLRLSIIKSDYITSNFDFSMRIINDLDTGLEKRLDPKEDDYQGEALDPGVIAGLGIAGAIIIIALILLAIYLCVRARDREQAMKEDYAASSTRGESSVYTSGNSQALFATKERQPRGRYGSMEDIRSTTSQEKAGTNGTYSNPAYSKRPWEKESERQASVGRAKGRAGFENAGFDSDDMGSRTTYDSWQENEVRIGSFRRQWNNDKQDSSQVNIGSFRRSRRDEFQLGEKKKLKSALKKPTEIEMSKVNTQPINGILKTRTARSPNRSQTSSTEGSYDMNALVHGYSHTSSKTEHPNIKHKPVIEKRRSRSGTRSNRSTSSHGSHGRRSHSADRKPKPKPNSRMYQDVFLDDRKPRSSSRSRARSSSVGRRRDRGSDSIDSESSATSSRRVNMNPGGKRVHIKGEETDI